jgi:hypothetical protein
MGKSLDCNSAVLTTCTVSETVGTRNVLSGRTVSLQWLLILFRLVLFTALRVNRHFGSIVGYFEYYEGMVYTQISE